MNKKTKTPKSFVAKNKKFSPKTMNLEKLLKVGAIESSNSKQLSTDLSKSSDQPHEYIVPPWIHFS